MYETALQDLSTMEKIAETAFLFGDSFFACLFGIPRPILLLAQSCARSMRGATRMAANNESAPEQPGCLATKLQVAAVPDAVKPDNAAGTWRASQARAVRYTCAALPLVASGSQALHPAPREF